MKPRYIVAAVVAVLAASVGGYAAYQGKYGKLAVAQEAVKAKLLDGDSAKFKNVREMMGGQVCGEVNAKNRYGAYVGFNCFSVRLATDRPYVTLCDQDLPSLSECIGK